jgi:hypothetical protein
MRAILRANLGQDSLRGQLHPTFHFDNGLIAESLAYIEDSRSQAARALHAPDAWAAFGRLTHAAQDFYSHSNYVALWAERYAGRDLPPVAEIDGLDPMLLRHPRLATGHVYPLEVLWYFPRLRPWVKRHVPRDAHAWMNLDSPNTGPHFPYSLEAAVQRTAVEFERTLALIGEERGDAAMAAFCDGA